MSSIKQQLDQAAAELLRASRPRQGQKLGLATLAVSPAALAVGQPGDWDISTAVLVYSEPDRVSAAEPVLQATRYFHNDRIFSSKLVLDALTGASANGAVPSNQFQTFTRPSGRGSYDVSPGDTVLDDTFRDTRVALSANWTQPLLANVTGTAGLNISNEYDYLSIGANGVLDWDLNRKNTRLSLGLGFAADSLSPEGRIPTPLAELAYTRGSADGPAPESTHAAAMAADDTERDARDSSADKDVVDVLLGVTQVIDRRTLVQLNYSLSMADGYLTDPFKVVSVVDSDGQPVSQRFENRPDSRTKHAVFGRVKRAVGDDDALDLSYRYLWDDWGLTSHTLDLRYRFDFGSQFLQPHLRYYQQSATDFFRYFVNDSETLPSEVSADYRLGDMQAITAGLEYGRQMHNGHQWRVALEYYLQTGSEPGGKPGQLARQTLAPDVDAIMLRFNYDFTL